MIGISKQNSKTEQCSITENSAEIGEILKKS